VRGYLQASGVYGAAVQHGLADFGVSSVERYAAPRH
jgi:hypothetical protein